VVLDGRLRQQGQGSSTLSAQPCSRRRLEPCQSDAVPLFKAYRLGRRRDPSVWMGAAIVPALYNHGALAVAAARDQQSLQSVASGLGDGDMVSVEWTAPYMEVYYGIHDGAGGLYAPGHTFWITVANTAGDVKATGTVASTADGGWWGGQEGFRPTWANGGDCCAWSPAEPDTQPGDWVYFQSDDGYENQVRAGAIFGTVNVEDDSVIVCVRFGKWITFADAHALTTTHRPQVHPWTRLAAGRSGSDSDISRFGLLPSTSLR
jgi:hypothetical protein